MLENNYLITVTGGGFSISASFLNSIARSLNTIMDMGRSLGTALRMLKSKTTC